MGADLFLPTKPGELNEGEHRPFSLLRLICVFGTTRNELPSHSRLFQGAKYEQKTIMLVVTIGKDNLY